jgi:hypothetical protein
MISCIFITDSTFSIALLISEEDIVGINHQATTGEDTADWADLVHPVVNCRLCELEIEL